MSKTVLITGGTGFIGSNLTMRLINEGYQVHLFIRKSSNFWRIQEILSGIQITPMNLLDDSLLKKAINKIKPMAIFHLASYGGSSTQADLNTNIAVNVQATTNLLLATKDIPYTIFINTGSSSEYGFKKKPMLENDFLEPNSYYSATKAAGTYLCQVFARNTKKPIVTLRPFSVYGPYEGKYRLIHAIMKNLITKKPIRLTAEVVRHDFIFIDDVVNGYIAALCVPEKVCGKVINLGTGKEYSNEQVVKTLFAVTNTTVPIEKGAYKTRTWDTNHWRADISLARKLLNWNPRYNLKEGLLKTYHWYKENMWRYNEL